MTHLHLFTGICARPFNFYGDAKTEGGGGYHKWDVGMAKDVRIL